MEHPYTGLPDKQFWRKAVSDVAWSDITFVESTKFTISSFDMVATAGSCFAQNITRYLRSAGCDIFVAEPPHPLLSKEIADELNYGQYSARYGNVYTVRQLLQLFEQAVGEREVIQDFAVESDGVYDLLRPSIAPRGFSSLAEAKADRAFHIQCVRRMFESASVFIFTLGLTEAWENSPGNYVYPSCPGTVKGVYDPAVHRFVNFTFNEILAELTQFLTKLKMLNPKIRVILTVSPVSLAATYENQHVLLASSHSKSVLRAVCGEIESEFAFVEYFPSFEIISSPCSFGQYLDASLRGVSERGVRHVMSCFFKTYLKDLQRMASPNGQVDHHAEHLKLSEMLHAIECEELLNDPGVRIQPPA